MSKFDNVILIGCCVLSATIVGVIAILCLYLFGDNDETQKASRARKDHLSGAAPGAGGSYGRTLENM